MRLFKLAGALLLVANAAGTSRADNVLVFGDHGGGRERIAAALTDVGHTSTDVAALPADLEGYDAIWHVGVVVPLSDGEQQQLEAFLGAGGGLYLTGEGTGAEAMNASVEAIVDASVTAGGITLSTVAQSSNVSYFNAEARGGVTTTPNALTGWQPTLTGAVDGASDDNVLARSAGQVTGAVWAGPDLATAQGQLVVMMDAGWTISPYSIERMVENLERFLQQGVAPFCGNAVAEPGETCDDGNDDDGDACLTSCDAASCGDGFRGNGEQCDDGNLIDGDGCDASCVFEIAEGSTNSTNRSADQTDDASEPTPGEVIDDLEAGGCSTGGGGSLPLAAIALGMLAWRRRRAR